MILNFLKDERKKYNGGGKPIGAMQVVEHGGASTELVAEAATLVEEWSPYVCGESCRMPVELAYRFIYDASRRHRRENSRAC